MIFQNNNLQKMENICFILPTHEDLQLQNISKTDESLNMKITRSFTMYM